MIIKVFISYCTSDKGKMNSLRKRIQAHSALRPIVVADDRKASKLLSEKVKDGIKDCDIFVCILTSKSIANQWVNQEIGYATALKKEIRPIVEKQLLNKLKGFVHKQIDLPYLLETKGKSPRTQSILFSQRAKVLVDDILIENGHISKEAGIESFFSGIWSRERKVNGRIKSNPRIEIKNGNEYHSMGRFNFVINDFQYDQKQGVISFTKRNPQNGGTAQNVLNVVQLGMHYEGTEEGRPVTYRRVV